MRRLSLLAALGLASAGLVTATPAATAAPMCSLYLQSTISIGAEYREITAKEGPNCAAAHVTDAGWLAYHPSYGDEPINGGYFESGSRSEPVAIISEMPLGRWSWKPEGAYAGDVPVAQYGPYTTDVRLASYARVVATRTGSSVNLKTTARRYWAGGDQFIGWGARGQLQWRTPGSTTWHGLKDVYSTSTGAYSCTYSTSASRDYRVVLNAVPTIWGATSPVVRR